MTIETLQLATKVTDSQLDYLITKEDITKLATNFDCVENYLDHLRLAPCQQTDIKDLAFRRNVQIAMIEALRLWREPNPCIATYRALLELLMDLGKGEVALRVCSYLKNKT